VLVLLVNRAKADNIVVILIHRAYALTAQPGCTVMLRQTLPFVFSVMLDNTPTRQV